MKWMPQNFLIPLILSVTGIGAAVLYFSIKKDDDDDILKDSSKTRIQTSRRNTFELKVPRECIPVVIGSDGSTVKEIQETTETHIRFRKEDVQEQERVCIISGMPENIRLAENMIKNLIANQPVIETQEMFIPTECCGAIIGRGGESIREIQNSSRTRITIKHFSTVSDGQRKVLIKGTKEQINIAISQIEERIRIVTNERRELEATIALRAPRGKVSSSNSSPKVKTTEYALRSPKALATQNSDDVIQAFVSSMKTPSKFWVQVFNVHLTELDKLVSDMTEYYNNEENQNVHILQNITVGQIVAVKYICDGMWYRGEIVSVTEDDEYEVHFVDYGDQRKLNRKHILELRTDFLSLRKQAIECRLANIKPRGGKWSSEACGVFYKLAWVGKWRPLTVLVKGYKSRVLESGSNCGKESLIPCIDLIDDYHAGNIAEKLIKMDYADYDENIWSLVSPTASETSETITEDDISEFSVSSSRIQSADSGYQEPRRLSSLVDNEEQICDEESSERKAPESSVITGPSEKPKEFVEVSSNGSSPLVVDIGSGV